MNLNTENNRFKDNVGKWFTQSLFLETKYGANSDVCAPIFTLKDNDYKGLISLKRVYLELRDPTEYRIATEWLGGWQHWKALCSSVWFMKNLTVWREELEVKMKAENLKKMYEIAQSSGAVAKDAAKFFINREWEVKRGRPSKEEKARQLRINSQVTEQVENDFKLLNLNT